MPSVSEQLWELQGIDVEIERLRHEIRALQARLGESAALRAAREAAQQAEAALRAAERELRDRELAVGSLRTRLAADEKKLYDGSIRSSKELSDLAQNVEHEKARLRQLEDRQLDAMDAVERAGLEQRRTSEELARVERAWQAEQERLTAQIEAERAQGRAARRRRESIVAGIDPAALQLYDRLVAEKRGRAVARVEQSTCQACRVAIPLPVVNRARASAEPVFCPSCGRILVVAR